MQINELRDTTRMPFPVVWFERLMYTSLVAGIIGIALYAGRADEPVEPLVIVFILMFITVIIAGISTLIWLVARRRKGWARYVVCGLYVMTIPHFLRQVLGAFRAFPLEDMLAWSQLVMVGIACALVFSGGARAWFAPQTAAMYALHRSKP
jgi:hypothetical protein